MKASERIKRYIVFLVGLFIVSLGISFITKGSLGTSQVSSIPYVLSLKFTPTLGQFTVMFSLFLILLQVILLGRKFKVESLLQLPASFLFGYFIDFTTMLLKWLHPTFYATKLLTLAAGCFILAFGVYFEVMAQIVMLPGESFSRAVSVRFNLPFGNAKVICDVSMVVVAVILSFALMRGLYGVREGTVISAVCVGFIVKLYQKNLIGIKNFIFPE